MALSLVLATCPVSPGEKTNQTGTKHALTALFFLQVISAESSAAVCQILPHKTFCKRLLVLVLGLQAIMMLIA